MARVSRGFARSAILYTYAQSTYEMGPAVPDGPPEICLLLAVLDRAKRDYLLCPKEEWESAKGVRRYDHTGASFLNASRRAYMWATARSREPFSYFWIRDYITLLPRNGADFLTDGRAPEHWYLGTKPVDPQRRKKMRLRWR